MEVVIGFAVGYWVGTRQGRQGLQTALESAQAIWAHPETRRMLAVLGTDGRAMHEYGLAEGVLATVRQRAAGRKVAGIRVRFGVKHAVDEESMTQAWGFVAEGTEAEGSAVALVIVPATLTCQECGLTADTTDVLAICPGCRGENVEITGGDEMTLESITYEPARTG